MRNYVFMKTIVTATEAARRFGDLLAEIKHTGSAIEITKNGQSIATLQPVRRGGGMTLKEFAALWADHAEDYSFADDLERINRADQPPANPWA